MPNTGQAQLREEDLLSGSLQAPTIAEYSLAVGVIPQALAHRGQAIYLPAMFSHPEGRDTPMTTFERFERAFARASAVAAPTLALLGLIAMAIALWHLPPQGVKGFTAF